MTAPVPLDDATRERMRRQRCSSTGPELALRAALRRAGATGYRVGWRLPLPRRTADVAFPGRRVAVFVDGCFWHGCPDHSRPVRHNGAWWAEKVARNRQRDADTSSALEEAGWAVLRVWEHQDPDEAAALVVELLEETRRGGCTSRGNHDIL